jgi:hypothetical protein
VSAVTEALQAGQSPLNSDAAISSTWAVINETVASLGSVLTGNTQAKVATTPVALPLPFYLINNVEPFARVYLNDISGGNSFNVFNQTFISWQIETRTLDDRAIDSHITPPLETTTLQLVAYYGGSASVTAVQGVSPEFTLTLSQNPTSRKQNGVAALTKYILFIWSAVTGLYPNQATNNCIVGIASSVFNDKFPAFATQPDAASASAYFSALLPISSSGDTAYKRFSACGALPTPSQLFGAAIGTFWKRINLVRSGIAAFGAVAETFNYWAYNSPFQICKTNGKIVTCDRINITQADCVKVKTVSNTSGYTGPRYDINAAGSGVGNSPSDIMTFTLQSPSTCYGCDGKIPAISCSSGWQVGQGPVFVDFLCKRAGGLPSMTFNFSGSFNMNPSAAGRPQSVTACFGTLCTTKPLMCPA